MVKKKSFRKRLNRTFAEVDAESVIDLLESLKPFINPEKLAKVLSETICPRCYEELTPLATIHGDPTFNDDFFTTRRPTDIAILFVCPRCREEYIFDLERYITNHK